MRTAEAPEGGTLPGDSPPAIDGGAALGAGHDLLVAASALGPQQGTPQAAAAAQGTPRHMPLEEAIELLQAAERGRQARERVAVLQTARVREEARAKMCKGGKVARSHPRGHFIPPMLLPK